MAESKVEKTGVGKGLMVEIMVVEVVVVVVQ